VHLLGNVTSGPWGVQCSATSKQSGERCKKPAIAGGNVCRMHGGAVPAAKRKAAENKQRIEDRIKELGDRAVQTLTDVLDDESVKPEVRVRAAETILDRIVGKKIEAEVTQTDVRDLDAEIEAELGELPEPEADSA
jgi:hypothetical protein